MRNQKKILVFKHELLSGYKDRINEQVECSRSGGQSRVKKVVSAWMCACEIGFESSQFYKFVYLSKCEIKITWFVSE